MYARLRFIVLVFISLIVPSLSGAQQASARTASAGGPRLDAVVTGIQTSGLRADNAVSLQRSRENVGKPVALMIVGGAAIVVGAVIGGDVGLLFMIGGAIALLIGLYRYLQ